MVDKVLSRRDFPAFNRLSRVIVGTHSGLAEVRQPFSTRRRARVYRLFSVPRLFLQLRRYHTEFRPTSEVVRPVTSGGGKATGNRLQGAEVQCPVVSS